MKNIKNKIKRFVFDLSIINLYGVFEKHVSNKFKLLTSCIVSIVSPTYRHAHRAHQNLNKHDRKKSIIARNYFYLSVSLFIFSFVWVLKPDYSSGIAPIDFLTFFFIYILCWSRCNEILFSFIKDALDKTSHKKSNSALTYRKRIELALLSYIELIVSYASLYFLMPSEWFDPCLEKIFSNTIDAIYFSGVTITTLGYGDYSPEHFLPKLLVVHQVLAGFTLIVVSFAIYAGKGLANDSTKTVPTWKRHLTNSSSGRAKGARR